MGSSTVNGGEKIAKAVEAGVTTALRVMGPNQGPVWLKTREAEVFMGVSRETFRKWRKEMPDFPKPMVLGTVQRFLKDDLHQWMLKRRPASGVGDVE